MTLDLKASSIICQNIYDKTLMETRLEHVLTHSYKADMIAFMKSHPEHFNEALELAIANKQPYSWRAAWLLWSCMEDNDPRIRGFVEKMVNTLPNICDDQARELLIILHRMELSNDQQSTLFDICINVWTKTGKQPSVRYNAFKLMVKIANEHPDLSKEIIFLTEPHYMDSLSDTVKRSISRMMADLV